MQLPKLPGETMIDPEDILTIDNLKVGISVWRNKPRWDQDFHSSFYEKLHRNRVGGLNREWWDRIVDDLSNWKAIRPYTKEDIHKRGIDYLPSLQKAYLRILELSGIGEPDLEISGWETLKDLFGVAADIKETMPFSPVFASKLCHFIFPSAYPVVDRQVVGLSGSYSKYWRYCQVQWSVCKVKSDLIGILKLEIGAHIFMQFPWSTKIVELCMIGKNRSNGGFSR